MARIGRSFPARPIIKRQSFATAPVGHVYYVKAHAPNPYRGRLHVMVPSLAPAPAVVTPKRGYVTVI